MTKQDILDYINGGGAAHAAGEAPEASGAPAADVRKAPATPGPTYKPGERVSVVPMSVMRKKIAEHMVLSAHTSPHVYSVYEVNFARINALREKHKAEFEAAGAKLTFTAFIAKAAIDALRQFPIVNASVDGDNIVYKKDINLGIAVALDNGLIVPVIRNADEKNLLGLTPRDQRSRGAGACKEAHARRGPERNVHDYEPWHLRGALRSAAHQPAAGGNPRCRQHREARCRDRRCDRDQAGVPHHARYDHRLIDGAEAGRFLSFLKERLEKFEEAWI